MINNSVKDFIQKHSLIHPGSTVILGLSGGPDSVYLLHQLVQLQEELQYTLIAAHLNHGWRTEATHDEEFCKILAAQLNVPFVSAHASEFKDMHNNGSQEAYGRNLRRAFFARIAQKYSNAAVALAHHKDDQIETFFIRLIRGAGLEGLRGMKPHHDMYIRPLLTISKAEILSYLHSLNIAYCIDHTNEQDTYLRNRIRTHALPALHTCDDRIENSVLRTMEHFGQLNEYLQEHVDATFATLSELRDEHVWISLEKLFTLHSYMQQQILLHWICHEKLPFTPSQGFFEELMRFLKQPGNGEHKFYQKWSLVKKDSHAMLRTF